MMRNSSRKTDLMILGLIIVILTGLPMGIWAYDKMVWDQRIPQDAKVFSFTGHTNLGWVPGQVDAYQVAEPNYGTGKPHRPVITVDQGDTVVFKLSSSDVIHGFSLKDFGIFIDDGIRPGKVTLVTFKADKPGTYTFSCNIICGDQHQNMQGTLIVKA